MNEKAHSTPRWREIVGEIENAIQSGDLKPGMPLPSEVQLSLDYSVSRMTANKAMTELQGRGLVVRKRRVGTVVAHPSRPRTNNVAVLCYYISNFPTAPYLSGLREGLSSDYGLLLCDTGEEPAKEAYFLEKMRNEADAIVCMPSSMVENNALLQSLIAEDIPLLCLDRVPEGIEVDAIVSDNYGATLQALRLLTSRGHRRIAFLSDLRPQVSSVQERLRGHQDALREVGEENPEELVRFFTTFTVTQDVYYPQLVREVHDAIFSLLHKPNPPTAIFCLQDAYMAAALEACAQIGVEVPGDLEIVAFNDCPPQFLPLPAPVLRIVQQPHQMGVLAGQRITAALRNGSLLPEITRVTPQVFDPLVPVPSG
ncbi:GntR family transcriptional regulator [bacterium]|nr:MAG: GntR family transcriptional regulator [bacterium]